MSIPSPAELRNTKQPIPTAKLVRWAEEAGFDIRRSGGGTSHLTCRHKIESDIWFSIIEGTRRLSSQRDLSDSLIELERRKLNKAFEKAVKKEQALTANVPDHISAELNHETGNLILRDRQLPQIGVTIRPDQMHMLENRTRFLDDLKRETFIAIKKAKTAHDIDIDVGKHDVFDGKLSHLVYDMEEIDIPAYQEGSDPRALINAIGTYTLQVLEKDQDHKQRLENISELPFIREKLVIYHARRGERTVAIDYESPTGKPLHIQFECFSNTRNPGDAHDIASVRISDTLLDDLEHQMMGIARAHKRAHKQPHAEAA